MDSHFFCTREGIRCEQRAGVISGAIDAVGVGGESKYIVQAVEFYRE